MYAKYLDKITAVKHFNKPCENFLRYNNIQRNRFIETYKLLFP